MNLKIEFARKMALCLYGGMQTAVPGNEAAADRL